jgi:phage shock protein E
MTRTRLRRAAPALALAALALAGCAETATPTPDAASSSATADSGVRIVRADEAASLIERPGVTLLDVRTPEEFAEGHIEGAVNIDMQAPDAAARFTELDPDGSYVVYCRSGNRSSEVREFLREQGFTDVADVYGGILSWQDAGLPVTR